MMPLINAIPSLKTKTAKILAKQKDETLAAFYTPRDVAQILTDWALVSPHDTVLDPSYGGCSFLESAQKTLLKRGNSQPESQIFGVDIDPDAQFYVEKLITGNSSDKQFIREDFFKVNINNFETKKFNAVVGNPPYLRFHSIPKNLQISANNKLKEFGINLSGRSSYWAYFLLYSIQLLQPGGRLAMVLPGAILHTDYSLQVREHLIKYFKQVNIFLLQERIFDGTQEESVIVCAQGAHLPNQSVQISQVSTVQELSRVINNPQPEIRSFNTSLNDNDWLRNILETEINQLYDDLSFDSNVIKLGEWVESRIGVVTGNNNYFIMSEEERKRRDIPSKYFLPVIKRSSYINGLTANNQDLEAMNQQNKDYLLLYPPADLSQVPESLRLYIKQGEIDGVNNAWKCRSRSPWYVVPHVTPPAAFIPCMAASWTRLIINKSNFTCTNNILRLSWKSQRPDIEWTRLALGMLSTFSQLSAELVGRSYGGGVLKLEPTELSRLCVPLIRLDDTELVAKQVDILLRQKQFDEATVLVDLALSKSSVTFSEKNLQKIRSARNQLFFRRRQHKRNADKTIN